MRILVIVGVAAGSGYIRAKDLPWVPDVEALETRQNHHETLRATVGVGLEEFVTLIDSGAVVIDARPQAAFEKGHLAIDCEPPVLNVPAVEPDEADRARLMQLQGLPVVLYCASDTCDDAEEVYGVLQQLGFVDIWIYLPGWEGIVEAKLETASGPDNWRGFDDGWMTSPADEDDAYAEQELFDANAPDEGEP